MSNIDALKARYKDAVSQLSGDSENAIFRENVTNLLEDYVFARGLIRADEVLSTSERDERMNLAERRETKRQEYNKALRQYQSGPDAVSKHYLGQANWEFELINDEYMMKLDSRMDQHIRYMKLAQTPRTTGGFRRNASSKRKLSRKQRKQISRKQRK
jgi:hypothetical protein